MYEKSGNLQYIYQRVSEGSLKGWRNIINLINIYIKGWRNIINLINIYTKGWRNIIKTFHLFVSVRLVTLEGAGSSTGWVHITSLIKGRTPGRA